MWSGPARARSGSRPRADVGMVTAEAALVLPLMAVFALGLVWMLIIGIAQVRVVDAARDGARAVSRGDDEAAAVGAARRTAGADASVDIRRRGGLTTVTVSERVSAPGWLLAPLPGVTVSSESSMEVEDDPPAG